MYKTDMCVSVHTNSMYIYIISLSLSPSLSFAATARPRVKTQSTQYSLNLCRSGEYSLDHRGTCIFRMLVASSGAMQSHYLEPRHIT